MFRRHFARDLWRFWGRRPRHLLTDPERQTGRYRQFMHLIVVVRNRMRPALDYRETHSFLHQGRVMVDGECVRDERYCVGFMDVISVPESRQYFRLLYDNHGRFILHQIDKNDAKIKLCKVRKVKLNQARTKSKVKTYDGRTFRLNNILAECNDTIRLNLRTKRVTRLYRFAVGNLAMVTGGENKGSVGLVGRINGRIIRIQRALVFARHVIWTVADEFFEADVADIFIIGNAVRWAVDLPWEGHQILEVEEF